MIIIYVCINVVIGIMLVLLCHLIVVKTNSIQFNVGFKDWHSRGFNQHMPCAINYYLQQLDVKPSVAHVTKRLSARCGDTWEKTQSQTPKLCGILIAILFFTYS